MFQNDEGKGDKVSVGDASNGLVQFLSQPSPPHQDRTSLNV